MASSISRDMAIKELARRELARRQQQDMPSAAQEPSAAPQPEPGSFRAAQQQVIADNQGPLTASVLGGGQGLTFGFGDEIAAGLMTPIEMAVGAFTGEDSGKGLLDRVGDSYDRNLDIQRQMLGEARKNNPVAAMAGELSGAAMTMGRGARLGLSPTANAVKAGAGTGGLIKAGLKEGAAYGGLYGFGSGEGGVSERLGGAAAGGLSGALVGGAIPLGSAVVRGAAKPVTDAIKARANPGGYAAQKVAERFDDSRIGLGQAAARLQRNPGSMLVDEGGASARDLLRTTTNIPGPARDRVGAQLSRQAMGQGTRLKAAIRETFADPDGYVAAKDALVAKAAADADPLYRKAYQLPVPYTKSLQGVLETSAGKKALAKAEELASNEQFPFQQLFANQLPNGAFDIKRVPDMRGWDYVKRAMDDMIDAQTDSITRKVSNEGRVLVGLKNRMLGEIDAANPYYRQARAAFAGPKSLENAVEIGRRAMRDYTPQQVENLVAKMSPSHKEAMRLGAAEALRKSIDAAGYSHNAILKIFNNRAQTRVLRAMFDDDKAFGQFTKTIFAEARKRATYEAVKGNSTTARQMADMMDAGSLGDTAGLVTSAVTGGPVNATLQWIGSSLKRMGGLTPKVADEIAKRLMAQDPAAVGRVMQELSQIAKTRASAIEKRQAIGVVMQRALIPTAAGAQSR